MGVRATGVSLVITRNERMSRVVHDLAEEGRIVLTEASVAEIEESQTHRIAKGDFAYAHADLLNEYGLHHPYLPGPNRDEATLVDRSEVEHFHKELVIKTALQRQGRYRYLRWRSGTRELRRFLERYVRWFLVRILKIKSLTGKREEIASEALRDFR